MKKLTREQKQDVEAVVRKYVPQPSGPSEGLGAALGFSVLVPVLDMMFTGGTATMTFLLVTSFVGACGGYAWCAAAKKVRSSVDYYPVNQAGQVLETSEGVADALFAMEKQLSRAFEAAAGDQNDPSFQNKCCDIKADLKKLSPAFEIVSGGPNGYGTERFEFIIAQNAPKKPTFKTLSDVQSATALPLPASPRAPSALLKLAGLP